MNRYQLLYILAIILLTLAILAAGIWYVHNMTPNAAAQMTLNNCTHAIVGNCIVK